MKIDRRDFLIMMTGGLAAGCQSVSPGSCSRVVDAGPASRYAADGLYDGFRDQGFFLVRKDGKLMALSSYCTHRHCKLSGEADRSFYCPCHGSTFDPNGKVTDGPAVKDLPVLAVSTGGDGHLLVSVPSA